MSALERAKEIGYFLCQEEFSPEQQALGSALLICGQIVESAVEVERAAGEGREREALKNLLALIEPAYRALSKPMSKKQVTIVYHQVKPHMDCPDGICAAWVAARAFPKEKYELQIIGDSYLSESEYLKPEYVLPFSCEGRDIILVDFSYPRNLLKSIAERAQSLTVLDHHKSRLEDVSALSERILGGCDLGECGATFAWKYFFPESPQPWFLQHVFLRDTGAGGYYEGEAPESEAITTALSARRMGLVGKAAFPVFERLLSEMPESLLTEGLPAIRERDQLVEAEISSWQGQTLNVGDWQVPWLVIRNPGCYSHYSTVGSRLAKALPNFPFVAISTADDPGAISLRRRRDGDADLASIAKRLGGGGHERAAGFRLPVHYVPPEVTMDCEPVSWNRLKGC